MKTYHILIKGVVQGVGFRPFIYNFCKKNNINGWVCNSNDGVHLEINYEKNINLLVDDILNNSPELAQIISTKITKLNHVYFNSFTIRESNNSSSLNIQITPDISICKTCENEIFNSHDQRFNYAFNTCTNCGPRFSIITQLPYDRENTTMDQFKMCDECQKQYDLSTDRRYYSQTNSCPKCRVKLILYKKEKLINNNFNDLDFIVNEWRKGKIIAIKSIGGYLLTCDATNKNSILRLRQLKNRPTKPFALMYHDIYELGEDVEMGIGEKLELEDIHTPIVLMSIKSDRMTPIATEEIAPNLNTLGVMMPNTPLFKLLLHKFKTPIVATSANISNSTIIFQDNIKLLSPLSDFILANNREIITPQDDSVIRFSSIKSYRTIIRRSRGLAPYYYNSKIELPDKTIIATGAMLKSTFTQLHNQTIHISQFLGSTNSFEGEENYKNVFNHFHQLFNLKIDIVLTDKHPSYFTTVFGKELAKNNKAKIFQVQHHKAHFYAVLAENDLIQCKEKILGVIWDGTGYGDDGNIWGGEFFVYHNNTVKRVYHLNDFPFIAGDKMPKEPRISALVMGVNDNLIKDKFSKIEWDIYQKLKIKTTVYSTSIGRLFDAVASIVLNIDKQTFEGEAAMQLESAAYRYFRKNNFTIHYSYLKENELPNNFIKFIFNSIHRDLSKKFDKDFIAAKFHITLAHYIKNVAIKQNIKKITFSGGVFQNQWLIELILAFMKPKFELFFHKNLAPNDENISFGQLMYYLYNKQ